MKKHHHHTKPYNKVGRTDRAITGEELQQTAVYRIDIEQWSGKQKKADDDFPGAFLYGEKKRLLIKNRTYAVDQQSQI